MRIAYVSADLGVTLDARSGSSVHVCDFVGALVGRGADVTVFTPAPGARGITGCRVIGVTADPVLQDLQRRLAKELRAVERSPARAAETLALLLNQPLLEALTRRRGRFDVVYERYSLWSVAGLQFARRAGIPYVVELNAPLAAQQEEYRVLDMAETARAIEQQVLLGADRVLVTCEALRGYAHARGVSRRKIRILPCGVSRDLLAVPRRAPRAPSDEFVVGFVGTLKPWHGIDVLLETFLRLRAISPQYRLLMVGDGPLAAEARSFCAAHGLDAAVTFVGSVPHADVPRYLARMDAGVAPYPPLPSFYFSPLKLWEYAAAGVPIVASASGELPRLFPHRHAALLHEPGHVGKIVKHIERLRQDPDLGRRLARRARTVAKRHSWDRLAARFLSFAETLIGGTPRQSGRARL
jgi:glycosyltransferase involved in cell wall biosynthesis